MPKTFRKLASQVEMVQFDGELTDEIKDFVGGEFVETDPPEMGKHSFVEGRLKLWNETERQHVGIPTGNWIARGAVNELYPVSPEALAAGFEEVGDATP